MLLRPQTISLFIALFVKMSSTFSFSLGFPETFPHKSPVSFLSETSSMTHVQNATQFDIAMRLHLIYLYNNLPTTQQTFCIIEQHQGVIGASIHYEWHKVSSLIAIAG